MSEVESSEHCEPLAQERFRVTMADTDAAGVIFFGTPALWADRILSNWLADVGEPVSTTLAAGYGDPVVSADFAFRAPLRLDDIVIGTLSLVRKGTRSATLHFGFSLGPGEPAAVEVRLTRVRVRFESGTSIAVPLSGPVLVALEVAERRARSQLPISER